MFAPMAPQAAPSPKRRAVEMGGATTAELNSKKGSELLMALAKGFLQQQEEARNRSRDENMVIRTSSNHPFAQSMEESICHYEKLGEEARGKEDFVGHPMGKRPNALFRAVLVRFMQWIASKEREIEALLGAQGPQGEKVKGAIGCLKGYADLAAQESCQMFVTRCFRVKVGEGDEECHKWIFHTSSEVDIMQSFRMIRTSGLFASLEELSLEVDGAPRSGQSKKIHELVYGKKGPRKGGKAAGA
mmetsp:Transcript_69513/g.155929  ORF Transcript_69513/g.155929 Transcript_69513/m.155929 type:complete len:245 (+) Transcript_69513:82-816(+)